MKHRPCPGCSQLVEPANFCPNCGTALSEASQAVPTEAAPSGDTLSTNDGGPTTDNNAPSNFKLIAGSVLPVLLMAALAGKAIKGCSQVPADIDGLGDQKQVAPQQTGPDNNRAVAPQSVQSVTPRDLAGSWRGRITFDRATLQNMSKQDASGDPSDSLPDEMSVEETVAYLGSGKSASSLRFQVRISGYTVEVSALAHGTWKLDDQQLTVTPVGANVKNARIVSRPAKDDNAEPTDLDEATQELRKLLEEELVDQFKAIVQAMLADPEPSVYRINGITTDELRLTEVQSGIEFLYHRINLSK